MATDDLEKVNAGGALLSEGECHDGCLVAGEIVGVTCLEVPLVDLANFMETL